MNLYDKEQERTPCCTGGKYVTGILLFALYLLIIFGIYISEDISFVWCCIFSYIILVNALAFYTTARRDPGFLPQRDSGFYPTDIIRLSDNTIIKNDFAEDTRIVSIVDEEDARVGYYTMKYCIICDIYRPLDASHCSLCGHCILEKDHHCIWFSNCIGRNNMKNFYIFIFSFVMLLLIARKTLRLIAARLWNHFWANWVYMFSVMFTFMSFVFGMFGLYYIFLSIMNVPSRKLLSKDRLNHSKASISGAIRRMLTFRPMVRCVPSTV